MSGERDTLGFAFGLLLIVVGVALWSIPAAIILTGLFIVGAIGLAAYLRALGKRDP